MSTGSFENWAGNIAEIGPIYPFVGTEFMLFIAAVVFWLWWHIRQWRGESGEVQEEAKQWHDRAKLKEQIEHEDD